MYEEKGGGDLSLGANEGRRKKFLGHAGGRGKRHGTENAAPPEASSEKRHFARQGGGRGGVCPTQKKREAGDQTLSLGGGIRRGRSRAC